MFSLCVSGVSARSKKHISQPELPSVPAQAVVRAAHGPARHLSHRTAATTGQGGRVQSDQRCHHVSMPQEGALSHTGAEAHLLVTRRHPPQPSVSRILVVKTISFVLYRLLKPGVQSPNVHQRTRLSPENIQWGASPSGGCGGYGKSPTLTGGRGPSPRNFKKI